MATILPDQPLEQRVTHLESMVSRLLQLLVSEGKISINGARGVMGLPDMNAAARADDRRDEAATLRQLRDLQLANGIITEEEHAALIEQDARP